MKYILSALFIFLSINFALSQTTKIDSFYHEEESLSIGYLYSGVGKGVSVYHFLEIEYWDFAYSKYPNYKGTNKYYGLDIGLNKENFIAGPKMGITLNYGLFVIGAELILYTDFKEATMRYSPIMGIGNHLFKLTMGYHFKAINKSFEPVAPGQVNIAIKLSKLTKRVLP